MNEDVIDNAYGYWGIPTSTIDWCESNYVYSYYIAEFWNTCSNFSFLCTAFYGFSHCFSKLLLYECILIFIVGIGSALFHSTLHAWSQQLDEIPMIYAGNLWIYILYEQQLQSYRYAYLLLTILISISHYYCHFTTIFQCLWTCLVVLCIKQVYYYYTHFHSLQLHRIGKYYTCTFILAAFFWMLDYHGCSWLNQFQVNPQPHAWWHLFMGINCYYGIMFIQLVRQEQRKKQVKEEKEPENEPLSN